VDLDGEGLATRGEMDGPMGIFPSEKSFVSTQKTMITLDSRQDVFMRLRRRNHPQLNFSGE
jgi:hypothetical protein